jgi:site-specific DNA-cytosine methylase
MNVGSLFAGIAGFDEGLRRAGMHSVWQVEKEPFCLKVLKTRFPNAQRAEDILTCRGLTSSVPASRARIGRSRDRERDCAANVARSFTSLRESCTSFDPLGSSSRMFPDFSVVTTDETLRKSSGFSWSSAGMGFNGVCLTASFSESPSAAVVCSLSDVLESHAPPRFFLSAKAAAGILRRAKKRGRTLPSRLQAALEQLATPAVDEWRTTTTSPAPSRTQGKDGGMPKTALPVCELQKAVDHSKQISPSPRPLQPVTESRLTPATPMEGRQTSYWDDTQQTDTLDCSMLAKGQMMPEKRRFACVLTPAGSDRDTTQPLSPNLSMDRGQRADQERVTIPLELSQPMSVRRLTPTECEVLQGFPKGWTRLPSTTKVGSRKAKTLPDTELLGTQLRSTSFTGSDDESSLTEVSA